MDGDDCAREITQVADVCDEKLAAWAYWEFKNYQDLTTSAGDRSEGFYNKDGSLQVKKVKSLSRTYVQYAQGLIKEMKFITATGEFYAVIKVDTSITAPTVIYMHKDDENADTVWYPHGYDWSVDSYDPKGPKPDVEIIEKDHNIASFTVKNSEFNGQLLTFKLIPKSASSEMNGQDKATAANQFVQ